MTDLFEARKKRDKGISEATAHATHEFLFRARNTVIELIITKKEFTADDVWDMLSSRVNSITSPADPRALGGVLKILRKEKVIETTGRYVPSRRRHASPVMVWRALIVLVLLFLSSPAFATYDQRCKSFEDCIDINRTSTSYEDTQALAIRAIAFKLDEISKELKKKNGSM